MIPGYNHNIKYKDRVYHIQTEDSGVSNPHIITHIFFGGNIIHSVKCGYSALVGTADLNPKLVDMMQAQHKTMLKELIRGKYDRAIEVRSVNAASLNGPAPLNVEAGAQHRTSLGGGGGAGAAGPPPAAAQPADGGFLSATHPMSPESKIIEAEALQAAFESKDDKAVDSIFGNLISEKSLDEVILSYLADEPKR